MLNINKETSTLTLDPVEPGVGGDVGGNFTVDSDRLKNLPTDEKLLISLTCTSRNKTGMAGFQKSIVWQQEVECPFETTPTGIKGYFLFQVPDTCTPSSDGDSQSNSSWNIKASCEFAKSYRANGVLEKWPVELGAQPSRSSIAEMNYVFKPYTPDIEKIAKNTKSDRLVLTAVAAGFGLIGAIDIYTGGRSGLLFIALGLLVIVAAFFGKDMD